jgi:hypothetical protein
LVARRKKEMFYVKPEINLEKRKVYLEGLKLLFGEPTDGENNSNREPGTKSASEMDKNATKD